MWMACEHVTRNILQFSETSKQMARRSVQWRKQFWAVKALAWFCGKVCLQTTRPNSRNRPKSPCFAEKSEEVIFQARKMDVLNAKHGFTKYMFFPMVFCPKSRFLQQRWPRNAQLSPTFSAAHPLWKWSCKLRDPLIFVVLVTKFVLVDLCTWKRINFVNWPFGCREQGLGLKSRRWLKYIFGIVLGSSNSQVFSFQLHVRQ